jgi:protein-tyrosine phosphatase
MNLQNQISKITYFVLATLLSISCNNKPVSHQRSGIMEEAPNFRDLGGYSSGDGRQTVWGQVFRSETLSRLNDRDVEKMRALGIKTIIDFRGDDEIEKAPSRLPENVNLVRLPIAVGNNDSTQQVMQSLMSGQFDSLQCIRFMEEINRRFATEFVPQYRAFFEVLLQPESYPLVFHCTAGKDRTGFASAILLSTLGVDWDIVMEDYLLTNNCLRPQSLAPQAQEQSLPALRLIASVRPSYLNAAKDEIIQRYGSLDNYLQEALRIGEAEKVRLRACLLK